MLTRKVKRLLSLTAVAAPLLFTACSDNPFNPINDASGTYQLTVYAGRSIPATYTIQPGDPNYTMPNGGTLQVTGGNLVLSNNGTFIETNNYVLTPSGQASTNSNFSRSGTWTVNGTALSLFVPAQNGNPSSSITGTLDVDTVTYQEGNGAGGFDSFEYKR
jgi:hypothetical protein